MLQTTKLKTLKLLILDIDGVMTNGTKTYDNSGKAVFKQFNDLDFTAIKRFLVSGVPVVFLSGDENINKAMAEKRNIPFYWARVNGGLGKEKFVPIFEDKYKISRNDMAYVGDDIFDIPIMKLVGLVMCPEDALWDVRRISHDILRRKGGQGVVAEAFELAEVRGYIPKWRDEDFSRLLYIDKKEK